MDWISVEDRLPEAYKRVLMGGIYDGEKAYAVGRIERSSEFGTEWWYDGGNGYMSVDDSWVTHWAELPDLPKERNRNG